MNVKTRERDNIVVFDLEGEIKRTYDDSVSLHQLVKDQIEDGQINFLLNFDKVKYIDSMGVGELIACYKSIHDRGGKLKIMKLQPKIRFLFEITMITNILPPWGEENEAINSFSVDTDI